MKVKTLLKHLNTSVTPIEWIDKNGSQSLMLQIPETWTVKMMWTTPDGWLHIRVSGDFNTL